MFKSKKVSDHKLLGDVHEQSLQNPRQNSWFLCNRRTGLWKRLDAPQCPADNDEDARMSEQHRPDARSISIQQGVGFKKSTLFGKSLQAVRTTWQHVRAMSSILEYSRVSFERGKDFSEDRPEARSSRPDVTLIKIELRCFWKDITKNRPDMANFRPNARQPEPESQQF
jgi:hypothetical protein